MVRTEKNSETKIDTQLDNRSRIRFTEGPKVFSTSHA